MLEVLDLSPEVRDLAVGTLIMACLIGLVAVQHVVPEVWAQRAAQQRSKSCVPVKNLGRPAVDACAEMLAAFEEHRLTSQPKTKPMMRAPSMPTLEEMLDEGAESPKCRRELFGLEEMPTRPSSAPASPRLVPANGPPSADATPTVDRIINPLLPSLLPETLATRAPAGTASPRFALDAPAPPLPCAADEPAHVERPTESHSPSFPCTWRSPAAVSAASAASPWPVLALSVPSPMRIASITSIEGLAACHDRFRSNSPCEEEEEEEAHVSPNRIWAASPEVDWPADWGGPPEWGWCDHEQRDSATGSACDTSFIDEHMAEDDATDRVVSEIDAYDGGISDQCDPYARQQAPLLRA